jgi:hypothetical protein
MPRYTRQFSQAFTAEYCEALIDRFEKDPRVQVDPQPEYSTRSYLNISQQFDWLREVQTVTRLADPLLAEFFRLPDGYRAAEPKEWLNDGFVIARYKPGDICALHDDYQSPVPPANGLRLATMIFFLNDVEEGGELHFPVQELKVKPRQGHAVVFPAQLTHPHEVLPPKTTRYVLQTWVIDPQLVVLERDIFDELTGQFQ